MRAATPVPEENVLARHDPDAPSDDWPEFELHNVRVHRPSDNASVSLLQASEYHPLTVIGFLQPVAKEHAHLYKGTRAMQTIEIEARLFAYGQFPDGHAGIWAAGKAGWYTIKPSVAYKKTFQAMIEAVNVWYFIVDAYRPRMTGRGKKRTMLPGYTPDELFEKYAAETYEQTNRPDLGAAVIHEHRDFLFQTMMAESGAAWANNPLFLHLCETYPEDHATVKKRLTRPKTVAKARQGSAEPISSPGPSNSRGDRRTDGKQARTKGTPTTAPSKTQRKADSRSYPDRERVAVSNQRPKSSSRQVPSTSSDSEERNEVATTVQTHSDEDDEIEPRRAKSGLRLRPSMAGKSSARAGKLLPPGTDEDGEISTPTYSSVAGKRKAEHDDGQRKRRRGVDEVDEGIDMPSSPSSSEADDEASSSLAVRLKHEPDPIQEDTWICALDGCVHKVYNASDPDSQHLIREHYALHAYDDDERVQFVKKLKQPSLPVSHLLERVKMAAKVEGFPGSKVADTRFPQPIAQRY